MPLFSITMLGCCTWPGSKAPWKDARRMRTMKSILSISSEAPSSPLVPMNFQKKKTCLPGCWEYAEKRLVVWLSVISSSSNTVISPPANEVKVIIEWKLVLLTAQQPISQVTRNWGKERNFIQKSSQPRRWPTSVLKKTPWERRNSGFFYVRVRGLKSEVIDNCRHLWMSARSKGNDETSNNGCCGLSKRFLQIVR